MPSRGTLLLLLLLLLPLLLMAAVQGWYRPNWSHWSRFAMSRYLVLVVGTRVQQRHWSERRR